MLDARPASLGTTKLYVSKALTTPTNDEVYNCSENHTIDGGYAGTCHQCSEQKSEALEATELEYTLVITTCQASHPFMQGAQFNGHEIYKITRHGSRGAAADEAFYASVNGWSVVFSCVTRVGESFEDRIGKASRVEKLWQLYGDAADEKVVRIFYQEPKNIARLNMQNTEAVWSREVLVFCTTPLLGFPRHSMCSQQSRPASSFGHRSRWLRAHCTSDFSQAFIVIPVCTLW